MNYFTFNYTNKNGEEKELHLRLSSADAIEIENTKKVRIIEYLQEESMSMIITMLRYMMKCENKNFSNGQATQLYDELIDSGMTMKSILIDIIYETLVISGFLEKSDWEEMKATLVAVTKKAKESMHEIV